MARTTKNNIKKKDEPKPVHTCGECGWGKFYYEHSNLDMDGNPICLKCPFVENCSIIRSEKRATNGNQNQINNIQNVYAVKNPQRIKKRVSKNS